MTTADGYEHGDQQCLGVLLTNLGTPDAPTTQAVRRYLAEFLWDRRVIDQPRALWWLILHGVILRIRPARSARLYQKIWSEEGSPLLAIGVRQQQALEKELQRSLPGPVRVALAMRYGEPSIPGALRQLRRAGARRVLILPLYPQYSASTTASTFDAVAQELKSWRWVPELRMISGYHDDPEYIDAVASSIREAWQEQAPGEHLVFSFHGLPERFLHAGDPYHCFCHTTARLVARRLGLPDQGWSVVFQSRFGREEWLKPYADERLRDWASRGVRSVDVVCPGFAADCLETLEEIADQNRSLFLEAGGQAYRYIPALNDRSDHIHALASLAQRHSAGWPESDANYSVVEIEHSSNAARERALALGASQ